MIANKKIKILLAIVATGFLYNACNIPKAAQAPAVKPVPEAYNNSQDTVNTASINWHNFFEDKYLVALIDTAIKNNPEVLITLQDIEIARNKVSARQGALLPSVSAGGGLGLDKVGRYTSQGAGDASTEIIPGKEVPDVLTDMSFGITTTWEADIWGKLRSAKKAAFAKYLGSIEARNFAITNLVAELAGSYYELLSLDNQLEIVRNSIELQKKQLEILKVQKEAAVVTELAVKQFEAQLYNSQSLEFEFLQKIAETENKINFLAGRYPQKIERDHSNFLDKNTLDIKEGIPSQLLKNRPDIRQAETELQATNWDFKTAQKEFYPSLELSASLGMQAFKPSYLYKLPESLAFSLLGELAGPVINRKAIIAEYKTANAYQVEAMYEYQKAILNGVLEVTTELSNINNLQHKYDIKSKEVEALSRSVDIAGELYKAARANYLEVLTAQRDALSSKLELVEVKKDQYLAQTNVYRALGGGWK